ncbi:septum formation protein Maf [Palleronia sediminis]|uniref:dTTP/UTP pyrophosphatase n=1 Tax=Palleronia sediminis TaxID=2547833 RepID=A0A4R6A4H8_9RHOB|nr:Maf family protein [Palleronia sediminis]TDL77725.1 septum formation protein Maf [Palleronia sediminis]
MRLILGSGSPRRRELLAQIGLVPDEIRAPDIDETPRPGELPRPYCARMAAAKADALAPGADEIVIAADTTVALGRRILGKPRDADEARAFLAALSGRRHRVHTSVALRSAAGRWQRDVETAVKLKRLSSVEIEGYIATGDWRGKAGGYAIQGPAAAFVSWIQGSHSAVVGLPLHETAQLLHAAGWPLWEVA